MYWRYGLSTANKIDEILSKPDVTVDDLITEEEMIQECKGQNQKLLELLSKPESVTRLIEAALTMTSVDETAADDHGKSYIAVEVFNCKIPGLVELLDIPFVFSFLSTSKGSVLSPLRGSYFSQIVNVLLNTRPFDVFDFLEEKGEQIVDNLLLNIGTGAMRALLIRLITFSATYSSSFDNAWKSLSLADQMKLRLLGTEPEEYNQSKRSENSLEMEEVAKHASHLLDFWTQIEVVPKLVEKFETDGTAEVCDAVTRVLADIIHTFGSPGSVGYALGEEAMCRESIERVIHGALQQEYGEAYADMLRYLSCIVSHETGIPINIEKMLCFEVESLLLLEGEDQSHSRPTTYSYEDKNDSELSPPLSVILEHLHDFRRVLNTSPTEDSVEQPSGTVSMLGKWRLYTAYFIEILCSIRSKAIAKLLIDSGVIRSIFSLVFEFSNNSLLQASVARLFLILVHSYVYVFETEGGEDPHLSSACVLLTHIFEEIRLCDQLAESWKRADEGLRGFILQLADEIDQRSEMFPESFLDEKWEKLLETDLRLILQQQDEVLAGPLPDMNRGNPLEQDANEETMAVFGSMDSEGMFHLSTQGQQDVVFMDEDDDDDDEEDEEDDGTFVVHDGIGGRDAQWADFERGFPDED